MGNYGLDFDYRLEDKIKLMKVVEEARAAMPARDFEFFRRLGREIVFNGEDKLSDSKKVKKSLESKA